MSGKLQVKDESNGAQLAAVANEIIERIAPSGPNPKRGLVSKLSELLAVVERVPKNGKNEFHKYAYATESDIVAAVRLGMADRNLLMVPNVLDAKWEAVQTAAGKTERLCTLKVEFELLDGDSGEGRKFVMYGQGQDPGDKSVYKAMTGAEKYALLKLFMIPTGDDPESGAEPAPIAAAPAKAAASSAPRAPPHWEAGEPPPHTDADVPFDASTGGVAPPPKNAAAPNYGNGAGKNLSDLDVKSLQFYEGGCLKSLANPDKAKFHDKERATLTAIRAWIAYRS